MGGRYEVQVQSANYAHIKFKRGGMCWKYGGAKRTHYEESTAFVLEYNRRKDYCNLITPPKNQSASVYLRRDKKEIDYHWSLSRNVGGLIPFPTSDQNDLEWNVCIRYGVKLKRNDVALTNAHKASIEMGITWMLWYSTSFAECLLIERRALYMHPGYDIIFIYDDIVCNDTTWDNTS